MSSEDNNTIITEESFNDNFWSEVSQHLTHFNYHDDGQTTYIPTGDNTQHGQANIISFGHYAKDQTLYYI